MSADATAGRAQGARQNRLRQSRLGRGAALARLGLRIGGRYVARSPRLLFASVERRGELRHDLALRSADEVAEELGSMKGVLMKLGQVAVGTLPEWAREMYGFDAAPAELMEREPVRQLLGALDLAFESLPGVLEARQRIELRTRA